MNSSEKNKQNSLTSGSGESFDGATILLVDDNPELLFTTQTLLESNGAHVVTATDGAAAVSEAARIAPALIVMDVVMPKKSGVEAARELKADEATREIPILLMSSRDELDDIAAGLEAGAEDYIRKPCEPRELLARVRSGLHLASLYREVSVLKGQRASSAEIDGGPFANLIGESEDIQELIGNVLRFKDSSAPVLIIGESGTGKELVARAVHKTSARARDPFVAQNCGAIHENLLESELFGYVKGAFTGAEKNTQGLFESANGGTLFLDEVGEMSLQLQTKLLRVIQEGVITPVGSSDERKVDVRIVAATHRNVEQMVKEGTFREDLFFRLKVLELHLPPLRERLSDLPLLATHFLKRSCEKQNKPEKHLTEEALLFFERYPWPGNIRELQNEIERIVSMSGMASQIGPGYLSRHFWKRPDGSTSQSSVSKQSSPLPEFLYDIPLKEALAEVESTLIQDALERTKNNKSEAARRLGISRSNLIMKVQAYGLDDE